MKRKRRLLLKKELSASRKENYDSFFKGVNASLTEDMRWVIWGADEWQVTSGSLTQSPSKRVGDASITFRHVLHEKVVVPLEWKILIQSFMVHRYLASNQAMSNQRGYVHSACAVAVEAASRGLNILTVTAECADAACINITANYSETTAYGRHKFVMEFLNQGAAHGIFPMALGTYRYAGLYRPVTTSGVGYERLDEPGDDYAADKMVDPQTIALIGVLYRQVPKTHPYRIYVLMLALMALLGRRFNEFSSLPFQDIHIRESGRASLYYFPKKQSKGRNFTPRKKIWLPTKIVGTVNDIINEISALTAPTRETAEHMYSSQRADTRNIESYPSEHLYGSDLEALNVPSSILDSNKLLDRNHKVHRDRRRLKNGRPLNYVYKDDLIWFCNQSPHPGSFDKKMVDQHGAIYYLKDLMLIKPQGTSSGALAPWWSTEITHSMFTTFLRYLPGLALAYADKHIEVDFTSHHFRHTINTLLNQGGLSEVVQAEWFARGLIGENGYYQHQTPESKAKRLREDLMRGRLEGEIQERVRNAPESHQAAIIQAMVHGVHDVGPGWCVHPLSRNPCPKAAQCDSGCSELLWDPESISQKDECIRRLQTVYTNLHTAQRVMYSDRPRASADWVHDQSQKIEYLSGRLTQYGLTPEEIESIKQQALRKAEQRDSACGTE